MKPLQEFITAILVSFTIGLALSYVTILSPWLVDLNVLEAVAVYHFMIHIGNYLRAKFEDQLK